MLAETPRLIFHNKQLQLTIFEGHLRYPIKRRQWRALETRLLLMTNVNFSTSPSYVASWVNFISLRDTLDVGVVLRGFPTG